MSLSLQSLRESFESPAEAPQRTRTLCILAHVDHGKTTLANNLIASNGGLSRASEKKMEPEESELPKVTEGCAETVHAWPPPRSVGSPAEPFGPLVNCRAAALPATSARRSV